MLGPSSPLQLDFLVQCPTSSLKVVPNKDRVGQMLSAFVQESLKLKCQMSSAQISMK